MRKKIFFFAILLAGTLAGAPHAQEKGAGAFSKYICDGNLFSASLPSDWEQSEEIMLGRQEKQYGVDLTAPRAGKAAFTTISLLYFGPDHLRFKTHEKYISTSLAPAIKPLKGEKRTAASSSALNGRHTLTFEKLEYNSIPPYAAKPVKVLMYDKYYVVPAKKGFYVLRLHSPKDGAKLYLKVFEKILASFKPTVK